MMEEYGLAYYQAGLEELDEYLQSAEMYWVSSAPPESGRPAPRLTLGGLLLARQRLDGQAQSPAEQARLLRLNQRLEAAQFRWRVAWGKKAGREYGARLTQWRNYLDEYRRSPDNQAAYYPMEVRWRVLLDLLGESGAEISPAEQALFDALEQIRQAVFIPGGFCWDEELAGAFPESRFAYLYGELRAG